MSIHELYDVSVLYSTTEIAAAAFAEVFGTTERSATIAGMELTGLAACNDVALSAEDIDLRLVGDDYPVGDAYIGLKLGIVDQFTLRRMRTAPSGRVDGADVWGPRGRMREATLLVLDLLEREGYAVLLHKAAAVVKSAGMFRYQAGDLTPERGERSFLAWLDVLAAKGPEGQAGECRSYGMPHYFGEPNVRTVVPHDDQFCIERTMQALKYTCARIAAGGEAGATLTAVDVPVWYLPGRDVPEAPGPDTACYNWRGNLSDDGLLLELRSSELPQRHPWVGWTAGETMDFDIYTKAVSDFLMLDIAPWGMTQVDAMQYEGDEARPPVRVLVHENDELVFYATAGLGRVAAASGSVDFATLHAELCLFAEEHDQRLEAVLLNLGEVLLTTPVEGGVKDWDGLPPQDGWGFVFVPMKDQTLGNEARPLAMRMIVPLTTEEYADFRETDDRAEWYGAKVGEPQAAAARWTQFCQHFS